MSRKGAATAVTIAVDAMGGDRAPEEIVRGIGALSLEAPHIQTLLVGPGDVLSAQLAKVRHDPERIAVHHAPDTIGSGDSPSVALAEKPGASILVAAQLVADGAADALVSAGNTGASVLACARTWK